jgi:nucleotide-binding universal stress UspA family protein
MTVNYNSILVAVDGSKEAEYAAQKAVGIANRNEGATLHIVHILDHRLERYDQSIMDTAQKEADELLAGYKAKAQAAGVATVNTIVQFGSPKSAISTTIADSVNADLILCGATGLNAVERFLVGSVSGAIVRTAKCDVLIVRTPEE